VYHGEYKDGLKEGYGYFKDPDSNEYDGQFKNDQLNGEGVYKEADTGRIDRALYENN
jgi:hypothetical protein